MDWLSLSPGPRPNARAYRDQEQVKIILNFVLFNSLIVFTLSRNY